MVTMDFTEKRDHWVALALSTAQPFVMIWLVIVLLAVATYALTASSPILGDATWTDAFHVGSSIWLLPLGATVSVGAVRVGLKPLAITIALFWFVFRAARRAGVVSWEDVAIVAATGALTALAGGLFAFSGTFLLSAVLGAAILGALAALLAWRSWLIPSASWWTVIESGWRYGRHILLVLAGFGFLLVVAVLIFGHSQVDALYDAYVTGRAGFLGLTFVQLLYLPNFVIWAASIASGAPIHVGEGASFSAFGSTAAPLPGIPFFGALPQPTTHLQILLVLPVIAGFLGGFLADRRARKHGDAIEGDSGDEAVVVESLQADPEPPRTLREAAREAGVALAIIFVVLACAGVLASGPLGSGRMLDVGVNAPLFALLATCEIAVGLAIAVAVRPRNRHFERA